MTKETDKLALAAARSSSPTRARQHLMMIKMIMITVSRKFAFVLWKVNTVNNVKNDETPQRTDCIVLSVTLSAVPE